MEQLKIISVHCMLVLFFLLQGNNKADDNVRVVVRCRPLNDKEVGQGFKSIVNVDEMRGTLQVEQSLL